MPPVLPVPGIRAFKIENSQDFFFFLIFRDKFMQIPKSQISIKKKKTLELRVTGRTLKKHRTVKLILDFP